MWKWQVHIKLCSIILVMPTKKRLPIWDALPYRENRSTNPVVALDSSNRRYVRNLSNSLSSLANLYMGVAEPDKAMPLYLEALGLQKNLLVTDLTISSYLIAY